MDGCKIEIESGQGQGEYYIPCNYAEYLGNDGVNHGGSSFTAYRTISSGSTTYPYIRFASNSYPVLYTSYQNYYTITPDIKFNPLAQVYRSVPFQPLILILLLMFMVVRKVTGK